MQNGQAKPMFFQMPLQAEVDADVLEQLRWAYPNVKARNVPRKLSITEIKRLYQTFDTHAAYVKNEASPSVRLPRFMQAEQKSTGSLRGSVIHKVLEHMDIHTCKTQEDVERLLSDIVRRGILSAHEAMAVSTAQMTVFVQSALAARMRRSGQIFKEVPFVMHINPSDFLDSADEQTLLHGIVDCYFIENKRIILVDYKSDSMAGPQALARRYALQMRLYKQALEAGTGLSVSERIIYAFALGACISVV
jgi:ATP-dependent helicase/nuclease subunit A